MSDIAFSLLAARQTSSMTDEKEKKPISRSPSSTDVPGNGNSSSSSTTGNSNGGTGGNSGFFSLLSLKSFFLTPGPAGALPSGTVRRMPALLMVVSTALLFTCNGQFSLLPGVNAGALPTSCYTEAATSMGYPTPVHTTALLAAHHTAAGAVHSHSLSSPESSSLSKSWENEHDQHLARDAGAGGSHGGPGPIAWNTPCAQPGEEGIWNCMATTWQRCVQGRWSVIMRSGDESSDTICEPNGISPKVKFVPRAAAGAAEGATTDGGEAASGTADGADGTESKWEGGGVGGGQGWNGRYWSGAADHQSSTRERMVFVLGVAGVVAFVLGMPAVV